MSIQRMRQQFAVHLRIGLWVIIAAFIIGLPLVFVPGRFGGGGEERREPGSETADVIARVDGKEVTRADLDRQFDRMVSQILPLYASMGQSIGVDRLWQVRYDAFEQAIQERLLAEKAREQRVSVSNAELKARAQQLVDQEMSQLKRRYQDEELERVLAQIAAKEGSQKPRERMSERQFRKWAMARHLDESSGLRDDLVLDKLRQSVTGQVPATEQDLRQSYDRATVRHILISLRPTGMPAPTEQQAKERADRLLARIRAGEDFTALAKAESDDPAAKTTGGLMQNIARGQMSEEWSRAVFSLKPGQVSDAIKLPWGYEIVMMEKLERQLPKDLEKNKQQLLSNFAEQRRGDAWRKYVTDLRRKAKAEVSDPEMLAYQALLQGKEEEALKQLEEAKGEARSADSSSSASGRTGAGLRAASVFYELARLLSARKQWEQAADAYAEAADALGSEEAVLFQSGRAEALMGMAFCYRQLGQQEEAVMWYSAASESTEDPMVHDQLLLTFRELGKADLVKREREWRANYDQLQRERQAEMEAQRKAAETKLPAGQQAGTAPPKGSGGGREAPAGGP